MDKLTAIREAVELYEWLAKNPTKSKAYYFRFVNRKYYVNNEPFCHYVCENFPKVSFTPDCRHCPAWPLEDGKDPLLSLPRCLRSGNTYFEWSWSMDSKERSEKVLKIVEELKEVEQAMCWDNIAEVWE